MNNCIYTTQGYLQCKETFENPYICKQDIISIKNTEKKMCQDVCKLYAMSKSCPYYSRNLISTDQFCECSPNFKNIEFEKDPFSIATIGSNAYSGSRLIGGDSARYIHNSSYSHCESNYLKTKGDGWWISFKDSTDIVPQASRDEEAKCIIHYNLKSNVK